LAFAKESHFHVVALNAGVKHVVRISITTANVHPNFPAYYPRTHWAIESMLATKEFKEMAWTSLQPNIFFSFVFQSAVALVKEYRKIGKQQPLSTIMSKDAAVGVIDPNDIRAFAATLLASDLELYNGKRYVLNGLKNINSQILIDLVKKAIGATVEIMKYNDLSFLKQVA